MYFLDLGNSFGSYEAISGSILKFLNGSNCYFGSYRFDNISIMVQIEKLICREKSRVTIKTWKYLKESDYLKWSTCGVDFPQRLFGHRVVVNQSHLVAASAAASALLAQVFGVGPQRARRCVQLVLLALHRSQLHRSHLVQPECRASYSVTSSSRILNRLFEKQIPRHQKCVPGFDRGHEGLGRGLDLLADFVVLGVHSVLHVGDRNLQR